MHEIQFDRDNTRLTALRRDGDGAPLVLLPGVMSDAATWQGVVDHIDLPNPVVVLNRRGRAPSGPLGPGYSLRTEIDDLHAILDSVGGEVELFGWSYGALIALEAALERPGLRSLVLYEPVSRPFGASALAPLRDALDRADLDRAVEIVNVEVSGFSADYVAELRASEVWPILRPLAAPLAEELGALNSYHPRLDRYPALTPPTTLILGELNRNTAPYGTAFATIAEALPQARSVELPGQGHLAHATAPELLAKCLTAAVADHD